MKPRESSMIFRTPAIYRARVSTGSAAERCGAEAERDDGDRKDDGQIARGGAVETGARRHALEPLEGVGERQDTRGRVKHVGHLVPGDEQAAEEELREHRRGQELDGLELRVRKR